MNSFTLLNLVLNPEKAKESDLEQLEELVEEHPYFQAGRLLIAKITKESEHIKTAAAYTSERTVLMDVINSEFNKDVNLPNIDHLEIGSDDLALFDKLGKDEERKDEKTIPKVSENPSFDSEFPDISFEVEEEKSEPENLESEQSDELEHETPPPLPDSELPTLEDFEEDEQQLESALESHELDNEIEEQSVEELTDELPSLELPDFKETEEATNLTEKSIDDILREMNLTSNDSENDGEIDSEEVAEFRKLRAEAEKSRLAAMEAMEREEKRGEDEKRQLQLQKEILQKATEEENPKSDLPDVEEYELPDYELPKDIEEKEEPNVYETSESKAVIDNSKSEFFDSEESFFGENEPESEEEIELIVEQTESATETADDENDFFEPKKQQEKQSDKVKSIFDADDSIFSLDALLEQSLAQIDPVKELEKQPVLQTENVSKKSIQNEQVGLIDNFIVKAPSLRVSKDKMKEERQENDLYEEQMRSQATPISENLATIMIKQQKFQKAIEIYEQLILKFPHKKAYFATLIEKLKNR